MNHLTNYYEGLKKAAEVPSAYIAEKAELANYNIPENEKLSFEAYNKYLDITQLIWLPLANIMCYRTKTQFDPTFFDEFIKDENCYKRGVKYHAKEIYNILIQINPQTASYINGKLTDDIESYDNLCYAIENKDEALFLETIRNGKCHIADNVNNLCFYLYSTDELQSELNVYEVQGDYTGLSEAILYMWETYFRPLNMDDINQMFSNMPYIIQELEKIDNCNSAAELLEHTKPVLEFFTKYSKWIYRIYYYDNEQEFTPREKAILDSVTTRPEVATYFEQWRSEFEKEEDDSIDDMKNTNEELNNNDVVTLEDIKAHKTSSCWIINGTEADAITWSYIIKESIIESLYGQVGKFNLPSKATPKQAQKYLSRLCAALIYKAAEKVGLAKPYLTTNGIGVSFNKTISPVIENYRRQDMMSYMTMLEVFDMMEDCNKRNSFNRKLRPYNLNTNKQSEKYRVVNEELDSENPIDIVMEFRSKNRELAHILLNNYDKIRETLSWLSKKIKTKMPK